MTENERVKAVRKELGLTLEKFGDRLGVTKGAMSAIETGARSVTDQMRRSICREFNVDEEWLRNGAGDNMFIQMSKAAEIDKFFGDVMADDTGFRAQLISTLARLEPDEWDALERIAQKFLEETKKRGDPE